MAPSNCQIANLLDSFRLVCIPVLLSARVFLPPTSTSTMVSTRSGRSTTHTPSTSQHAENEDHASSKYREDFDHAKRSSNHSSPHDTSTSTSSLLPGTKGRVSHLSAEGPSSPDATDLGKAGIMDQGTATRTSSPSAAEPGDVSTAQLRTGALLGKSVSHGRTKVGSPRGAPSSNLEAGRRPLQPGSSHRPYALPKGLITSLLMLLLLLVVTLLSFWIIICRQTASAHLLLPSEVIMNAAQETCYRTDAFISHVSSVQKRLFPPLTALLLLLGVPSSKQSSPTHKLQPCLSSLSNSLEADALRKLLPPSSTWDEAVQDFYTEASISPIKKAGCALLACQLHHSCHSAAASLKLLLHDRPLCHMDVLANQYQGREGAGLLQMALARQLQQCPHSVVSVHRVQELPHAALAVLNNLLSETGSLQLGGKAVPCFRALVILLYEAADVVTQSEDEHFASRVKDQLQFDFEASIGDKEKAVLARALRRRIDLVAPLLHTPAKAEAVATPQQKFAWMKLT
eukprot:gene28933-32126_t